MFKEKLPNIISSKNLVASLYLRDNLDKIIPCENICECLVELITIKGCVLFLHITPVSACECYINICPSYSVTQVYFIHYLIKQN